MVIKCITRVIKRSKEMRGYNIKLIEKRDNYAKFIVDNKKEVEVYIYTEKNYIDYPSVFEIYYHVHIRGKDGNNKDKILIYGPYKKPPIRRFNRVLKNINREYYELTNFPY